MNAGHPRLRLIVVLLSAAVVIGAGEWIAATCAPRAAAPDVTGRLPSVVLLPKNVDELPPPPPGHLVLMLGNSHTYMLPSVEPGQPLHEIGSAGIIIDELARCRQGDPAAADEQFRLLSYPNFLPSEMLVRVAQLLHQGYRPRLVILGVTWRNVARDSQLRSEIAEVFHDREFADHFNEMLSSKEVAAAPDILATAQGQRQRAERDEEQQRLRSDADRLDGWLTERASEYVHLMGESIPLRARLYRTLTERVQNAWTLRGNVEYATDLIQTDYDYNRQCLLALLRLLRSSGAEVVCYYAPERTDLPPLMNPKPQEAFMADLSEEANRLGVTLLDARHVVPNEYWGWEDNFPDRSHFTERGHQLLADFLCRELQQRGLWSKVDQP